MTVRPGFLQLTTCTNTWRAVLSPSFPLPPPTHTHRMRCKVCGVVQEGSQLRPGLAQPALGYPGIPEVGSCQMARAVGGCANVYGIGKDIGSGFFSSQSLGKSGNNSKTSCSLDRLQSSELDKGLSLECGYLVARVLTSVGIRHQGSEVISSRFHCTGPLSQSEPPKTPSGLLTAPPPCPGHILTYTPICDPTPLMFPWECSRFPT